MERACVESKRSGRNASGLIHSVGSMCIANIDTIKPRSFSIRTLPIVVSSEKHAAPLTEVGATNLKDSNQQFLVKLKFSTNSLVKFSTRPTFAAWSITA